MTSASNFSPEEYMPCLDKLVLPPLTDLGYEVKNKHRRRPDVRALKSMVVEFRCTITSFSLSTFWGFPSASRNEFIELLEALPALMHLVLKVNGADQLLHDLGAQDQGRFLPRLESLHLMSDNVDHFTFVHIANILDPKGKPGIIPPTHQWSLRHAHVLLRGANTKSLHLLNNEDEETVLRLIRINKSGINFQLVDQDGVNLFQCLEVANQH